MCRLALLLLLLQGPIIAQREPANGGGYKTGFAAAAAARSYDPARTRRQKRPVRSNAPMEEDASPASLLLLQQVPIQRGPANIEDASPGSNPGPGNTCCCKRSPSLPPPSASTSISDFYLPSTRNLDVLALHSPQHEVAASMSDSDPVVRFPPEVTLRMLELAPISSLANSTAVSKDWHKFIDVTHQEAIYSKRNDTTGLDGSKDLAPAPSFSQYLEGANSSKELCKRQTLLSRNWRSTRPMTTETVLQLQGGIQQFRADFSRRFFVSTSLEGLHVTDMDSGTILWSQPFLGIGVDHERYIQIPRLEYEDGVAVLNRLGRALEVWHTGVGNLRRGEFGLSSILTFEYKICRFHLSAGTLCVVLSIGDLCTWDLWPHL
ncbi:tRNA pseudouridine synthase 1 [Friedmanniomyces endolithicus]|nr:tRNA pseudouridine synthase 1 [Friedmanniomyces endolithicus]